MRNLIVQVDILGTVKENKMHGYFSQLYDASKNGFMKYAKKYGADYMCIHAKQYPLHATYERFQIFEESFDGYDMILYVDCDIIPTQEAPNIFEEYAGVSFAAFSEGSVFYGNNKEIQKEFGLYGKMENIINRRLQKGYIQEEKEYLSDEWLENTYFNGGVFLISKDTRVKVREKGLDRYLKQYALYDQSAMNKMIYENNISFTHLSYKYNGLFHFYDNSIKAKIIKQSYFIHFCGPMKNLYVILENGLGYDWQNKIFSENEIYSLLEQEAVNI